MSAPSIPPRDVTIVGAGIVGMSCALFLQRDGHRVTVVDPRQPGTATSFGNAGGIVTGSVVPESVPGLWKEVPGMLLDPTGPLRLRWSYLPQIAPWLLRFLLNGTTARMERAATALRSIGRHSYEAHDALVREAGAEGIVRRVGWLKVYGERGAERTARDRGLMERHGVNFQMLSADEIRQLEPCLAPGFGLALFQPDSAFCASPGRLVRTYAEHFLARGGRLIHEEARRIEIGPEGPRRLFTDRDSHLLDLLVVCAGAWSRGLAAQAGAPVPLDTERGYHLNLRHVDGVRLTRPVSFVDHGFVVAPMEDGMRLTTGVEFAGVEAPPDFRRVYRMLPTAQRVVPGLSGEVTREWLGYRPSLPDSLPVIGRAPSSPNILLAFGHGHLGLTLGPVTGKRIADLVAGRDGDFDLAPFRPDRF